MLFWIFSGLLAVVVALWLLRGLRPVEGEETGEAPELAIYRDQLAEVERDHARGLLTDDEAEAARIEVSRRLLEADKARATGQGSGSAPVTAGLVLIAAGLAGAAALYVWLGAPGARDLPLAERIADAAEARATRPDQATLEARYAPDENTAEITAEADYIALVDELRVALETRPDELQGWQLLAYHEAQLGRFAEAARAQENVLRLLGAEAPEGAVMALIDLKVQAAGGSVSPETETMLVAILDEQPLNSGALYYMGQLYAETGRPDIAFRFWREVVETADPRSPYLAVARARVEIAAELAGVRYELPEAARAPMADTFAEIAALPPEEQAVRVEEMVAGLSERLATSGGPSEDWAMLIRALGVLGRTEAAEEIWTEAQAVFGPSPADMAILREAAIAAGLGQ